MKACAEEQPGHGGRRRIRKGHPYTKAGMASEVAEGHSNPKKVNKGNNGTVNGNSYKTIMGHIGSYRVI